MSILIDQNSRIIVQGAAGVEGQFHLARMIEYGTKVVAGVDPAFKTDKVGGVPAYPTVKQAVENHQADTSIIFVPAPFAYDAVLEALEHGLGLIVIITEGVPVNDMIKIKQLTQFSSTTIIGPNCPGLISPGKAKLGIMPGHIHLPGSIGVISRSGTLTYEVVQSLTKANIGQSTCVGIGGDPIPGSTFIDILKHFNKDPETQQVILIGEIGGSEEEKAASYIQKEFTKPVVSFIAGKTAPPEKTMGHAGAIVSGGKGTAQGKIEALINAGIKVASIPDEIVNLIKK